MSSKLRCLHCARLYTRSKNRPFGRTFCSKKCFWAGAKISVFEVWRRDNAICSLCGFYCPLEEASRDHVRPRSGGGKTEWGNIRLAHKRCNSRKGSRDAREYMQWWEETLNQLDIEARRRMIHG
jgi:hypothetical protein